MKRVHLGWLLTLLVGVVASSRASTATAAPASANPFAGSYTTGASDMTITSGGRVTQSWDGVFWDTRYWGKLSGSVTDAGVLTLRGTANRQVVWPTLGTRVTQTITVHALLAFDADGNLVETRDDGVQQVWRPR